MMMITTWILQRTDQTFQVHFPLVVVNRTGHVHAKHISVDVGIQTEPSVPDCPKLWINEKISTNEIKSSCAILSSTCGVLVEMLRKIVQVVCKELYNHNVYKLEDDQNDEVSSLIYKNCTCTSVCKSKSKPQANLNIWNRIRGS